MIATSSARIFSTEKFDEFTYPSADLQIGAKSVEAVERGEYRWTLAELHPPVALLHHGFYWSCPDKAALGERAGPDNEKLSKLSFWFLRGGFHGRDRRADARRDAGADELCRGSTGQSAAGGLFRRPRLKCLSTPTSGDIRLRMRGSHEDLGSFARALGYSTRVSSVSFWPGAPHAAFALRPRDCSASLLDRDG